MEAWKQNVTQGCIGLSFIESCTLRADAANVQRGISDGRHQYSNRPNESEKSEAADVDGQSQSC
jgi:hypothetical protein